MWIDDVRLMFLKLMLLGINYITIPHPSLAPDYIVRASSLRKASVLKSRELVSI